MRDATVPVLLKEPGGDARPTMIPGATGRGGGAGLTDATSKRETPDCAARGGAVTARPTRSSLRRVIQPHLHRDSTAVRRSCPRVRARVRGPGASVPARCNRAQPDRPTSHDDLLDIDDVRGKRQVAGRVDSRHSGGFMALMLVTLMAQAFEAESRRLRGDTFPLAEAVAREGSRYVGPSVSENGLLAYGQAGADIERQLTWFARAPCGTQPANISDSSSLPLSRSADWISTSCTPDGGTRRACTRSAIEERRLAEPSPLTPVFPYQSSVGRWMASTTSTSTAPRCASSFSPSCSCSAA